MLSLDCGHLPCLTCELVQQTCEQVKPIPANNDPVAKPKLASRQNVVNQSAKVSVAISNL